MNNAKEINLQNKTMQSTNFLYWLQGLFEIGEVSSLTKHQVKIIQEHLAITVKDHPFVCWLEGFLQTQEKGVNKQFTATLKIKLSESFLNITGPKNILEELLKTNPPYPPWDNRKMPWDTFPGVPNISDRIIC